MMMQTKALSNTKTRVDRSGAREWVKRRWSMMAAPKSMELSSTVGREGCVS